MASVPNLPIAPAVPAPKVPGAPDAEGAGLDFFAQLLRGGPLADGVIGQLNTLDEVTLREAPAEGEVEATDSDVVPDGSTSADIIPLLQAQSGFPVAVVPAAPTPSPLSSGTKPPVQAATAQPLRELPPIEPVDGELNGRGEIIAAAVKSAIDKIAGKAVTRAEKPGRAEPDAQAQDAAAEPAVTATQQRPAEPFIVRVEAAIQPAAPNAATLITTPAMPQPVTPAAAPLQNAVPDIAQLIADRQLDIASDNQWLDRLARDIARAGAADEPLRFRLHPQTLGHLQVELTQGDRGTNVRLTVETEAARTLLVDAQPRLAAEARAQGVRLAGTEVDLGNAGQQDDARRNAEERPQDIVRVVRGGQSTSNSSAPAESRSDRYA